jgi:hypothetical protein
MTKEGNNNNNEGKTDMSSTVWQKIGKDVFQTQHRAGFVHVMHVGGGTWSVTLNGRIQGSAMNEHVAKRIAEAIR